MPEFTKAKFTEAIGYDCVNSAGEYGVKGRASLEERRMLVAELAAHFGWHFRGFFHDAAKCPTIGETLPGFEAALEEMTPQSIFIIYDPEPLFMVRQDSSQQFRQNGFDKIVTERGGTFVSVKQLISVKQNPTHDFRDLPGIKAIGYVRGWPRRTLGDPVSIQDQVDSIQREAAAAGWEAPIIYEDVKTWDTHLDPDDAIRDEMTLDRLGLKSALSALTPNHVLVVTVPRILGSWRIMNSFENIIEKAGAQWVTTQHLYKRYKNILYVSDNHVRVPSSQGWNPYDEKCWFCGGPAIRPGDRNRESDGVPFVASFKNQTIGPVCRPCTKLTEQDLYAKIDFVQYPDLVGVRVTDNTGLESINHSYSDSFDSQPEPFLPGGPPDDSYNR